MSFIGNLLWFICGGWFWGICMFLTGLFLCLTIIGIPFGIAVIRLSAFVFLPFGKELVDARDYGETRIVGTGLMSVIWIIFFGLWYTIGLAFMGLFLFVTIIGIPFGLAYFKIAAAAFNPLGKRIVSSDMAQAIRMRKANAMLDAKLNK